jgi:RsiW-degrading membrane proteinase PrsW (M82 family)
MTTTGTRRAPGSRRAVSRPAADLPVFRLPAFWIVAALLVAGGVRMTFLAMEYVSSYPVATLAAVALFAIYAAWFWVLISELDFLEPEPMPLQILAFAWGGLVATSVSISGSAAAQNIVAKLGSPELAAGWGTAIVGPAIEEIAKSLGLAAIVLLARAQVNSVLDGVVYGALIGLGFQIVEDVVFALGAVAVAGDGDTVGPVVTTFLLRGFLAGLWSHTLFGALAGAGIGYLTVRTDRPIRVRLVVAVLAVLGAWLSHALWNVPVLADGLGNGGLAVLAVLLLKGVPPLVLVLLLIRAAHDREADFYLSQLAELRNPEVVTEAELRTLSSGARRARARAWAQNQAGRPGRSAVRRLQRAQARLAVALSRAALLPPDPAAPAAGVLMTGSGVRRWRGEALRQRRALLALGIDEAVAPGGRPLRRRRTAFVVAGCAGALGVIWAAANALGGG